MEPVGFSLIVQHCGVTYVRRALSLKFDTNSDA